MANSDVLVRVQANTKNYDANMAKAARTLEQFKKDNLSLGGVMKQSTAALTSMAAQVVSVYAAVNAAKKVIGDMVRINKQFEQGTAVLASIIGKTTDEITALTNQAKQLGATTRYTAMQITELQTNLARLGFTEQEILNSTKAIQAFATATGADLGEAANLAGAALRGFGMNATEMERAASVMAVSTTKSALSFEKLATAIPIVAPVAKQFGFTIEDTVTLLAKLSDAGMDASTAATATRNVFLKMANDSGKLSQALGRPVHSVEEFGEALKEMREKGMSLNDILSMVGVRSTAAFAVFADNAETLKDFKQSITDCADAMGDMENKQLNTLQGSITILNSAWEGLMLTFSESNGVIKTVVDSLSNLLQAYTRWRNRNAGGDAAIQSYELYGNGLTKEKQDETKAAVDELKGYGYSDEQIADTYNKRTEAIEKERDAARSLYDQLAEIEKLEGKQHDAAQTKWNQDLHAMFPSYNVGKDGASPDYILRQIAALNDKISVNNYAASLVTPAPKTVDPDDEEKKKQKQKEQIALLRAQYEAEEKEQIASIDRKTKTEEEYEDEVYAIKKEIFDKLKKLYDEDSKEYAQLRAKEAQLDIQYQGQVYRRENKTSKTYETLTGASGYSEEGIAGLRKEIQGGMSKLQMGSSDYILQADRLVDLNAFENLLRAATQAGLEFDPSMLEGIFENIDLGMDISDDTWQALVEKLNERLESLNLPKIELDVSTGGIKEIGKDAKDTMTQVNGAAMAFQALGDAMSQIEDPGAKVAGLIAQAIGSVVAGYGAATMQASTMGPWAWIAFAMTGLATMISMVAGIKSATAGNYAQGGIIGGNSYSGDNMRGVLPNGDMIGLNSGEVVLNAAQQSTLAGKLNGAAAQTVYVEGMVSGKNLILAIQNEQSQSGVPAARILAAH